MTTTDDLAAFRRLCREFLAANATGIDVDPVDDPRGDLGLAPTKAFQAAAADAGLAGLTYPKEFGGQGLTSEHERIWRDEAGNFPEMTRILGISQGMCLPMLNEYGSDELRQKYQARLISGEEVWCQMISEPSAGSDVASLQTRATLDGDEWVLDGQKVWTTLAHVCDRGIVIARTDSTQPKHRGITMFVVDMHAPGVEVRPILQIDGGMRFNEVFFSEVRIPVSHQIGELNNGWRLATAMLMYERVAIGSRQGGIEHSRADALIAEAKSRNRNADPVIRQRLTRLYSEEVCQSLLSMQTRAAAQAGKTPGPGGSLGKLAGARIASLYRDLSLHIVGPSAVAWESDAGWAKGALSTLSSRIAGGTDEIQKNIIGERVLGLPRDISVDRSVPFSELAVTQ